MSSLWESVTLPFLVEFLTGDLNVRRKRVWNKVSTPTRVKGPELDPKPFYVSSAFVDTTKVHVVVDEVGGRGFSVIVSQ